MENSFKLNGTLQITMKPITPEWKHLMELVKDGDEFVVTKANNTTDVVFIRTGNKNNTKQSIQDKISVSDNTTPPREA